MKKSIIKILSVSFLIGMVTSCTDGFVEMNTNPNTTTVSSPETLLAPTLQDLVSRNQNRNMRLNNEIMQVHVTTIDSREFHRYFIRPTESDYMWRNWYYKLTDIKDIYENAQTTQQTGYQTFMGISLILDVWVSSMLTDMFGDVPYSDAIRGKVGNVTPKFDAQEDIYRDLFQKLEDANVLLANNVNLPIEFSESDPLYDGNARAWRKFGNSLYLRLLLRTSEKSSLGNSEKIREIVEGSPTDYPVFAQTIEGAVLPLGNNQPLISAFFNWRDFDFNGDKGYTEFFINHLNSWEDPRLPIWATIASGIYAGIPSGWASGQIPERQSSLQGQLKTDPRLGNIMNLAELEFIFAELALKGFIKSDPQNHYERGVISALESWDVEIPEDFLQREFIAWNNDGSFEEKMEAIHLQKYYSLFFTDFQQWHEYKRTAHPTLIPGNGTLNEGRMPVRLAFPVNVQALNSSNYQEALQRMGPDNINTKVWWNIEE